MEATGREHPSVLVHARHGGVDCEIGQGMQWRDVPAANPTSGTGALVAYAVAATYVHAGNLLTTSHTGAVNWTRTQSYTAGSNRLAASVDSSGTFNASDEAFGNLLAVPGLEAMSWDAFGMLHLTQPMTTGTDRTLYVYDATNNRTRKVSEHRMDSESPWARAADTVYLGGFELARKWTGSAADDLDEEIETVHLMDGESRIALIETQTVEDEDPITTPTPKWRFQLDDRLGSACLEIARDGTVISYEEYHAYGSTALHITDASFSLRRYRWLGKERDPESGLVYFGARYLAPWMGRWVSADPAGAVDGNAYRVVRGNPVSLREVDGRQSAWSSIPPDSRQVTTSNRTPITEEEMHSAPAVESAPGVAGHCGLSAEEVMARSVSRETARWQQGATQELADAIGLDCLTDFASGGLFAGVPLISGSVRTLGRASARTANEVLANFGGRAVRESPTGLADDVIARGRELARGNRARELNEGFAGARIEDALGVRLRSVEGTPSGRDFEILGEAGEVIGHIDVKGPRLRADGSVNPHHRVPDFVGAVDEGLRREAATPREDIFVVDLGGFTAVEQAEILSGISTRASDLGDELMRRVVIIGRQE